LELRRMKWQEWRGNYMMENLNTSLNAIRVRKWRWMRWAGHVARMVKYEMRTEFWFASVNGRHHSENIGVDGRIILKICKYEFEV
jgi:hypothetical protein